MTRTRQGPARITPTTAMRRKRRCWTVPASLLLAYLTLGADEASAWVLKYSNLSNGYSSCSFKDNGNGTSTLQLTIDYKSSSGHTDGSSFNSRGILIYTYDANGKLKTSSSSAKNLSINGVKYSNTFAGEGYVMYYGSASPWKTTSAFTAAVEFQVDNSSIAAWPAVGIRAGNFTGGNDVGESTGLAYLSSTTKGGACRVLTNPDLPPPPVDTTITMTAPDWDLGELLRGEETLKTFSATNQQLCFTYDGSKFITYQKFIINASNENGLSANGRYQLKHLEDSSQTVPYTLSLNSGSTLVPLPNTQNALLSLSSDGRMCFVPTFRALAQKWAKGGAYSDVLTFTIVAKP
ncbi:hypothetical protein [Pseudomonas sp. PH1b]|uniref:hypothetical protein n=1 Tax=Pseudomonas sp. PH1b TaxID=1397282 RepID=UPI0012FF3152|nr:hypothetical protein [Pseudomonas sp. PH1b]